MKKEIPGGLNEEAQIEKAFAAAGVPEEYRGFVRNIANLPSAERNDKIRETANADKDFANSAAAVDAYLESYDAAHPRQEFSVDAAPAKEHTSAASPEKTVEVPRKLEEWEEEFAIEMLASLGQENVSEQEMRDFLDKFRSEQKNTGRSAEALIRERLSDPDMITNFAGKWEAEYGPRSPRKPGAEKAAPVEKSPADKERMKRISELGHEFKARALRRPDDPSLRNVLDVLDEVRNKSAEEAIRRVTEARNSRRISKYNTAVILNAFAPDRFAAPEVPDIENLGRASAAETPEPKKASVEHGGAAPEDRIALDQRLRTEMESRRNTYRDFFGDKEAREEILDSGSAGMDNFLRRLDAVTAVLSSESEALKQRDLIITAKKRTGINKNSIYVNVEDLASGDLGTVQKLADRLKIELADAEIPEVPRTTPAGRPMPGFPKGYTPRKKASERGGEIPDDPLARWEGEGGFHQEETPIEQSADIAARGERLAEVRRDFEAERSPSKTLQAALEILDRVKTMPTEDAVRYVINAERHFEILEYHADAILHALIPDRVAKPVEENIPPAAETAAGSTAKAAPVAPTGEEAVPVARTETAPEDREEPEERITVSPEKRVLDQQLKNGINACKEAYRNIRGDNAARNAILDGGPDGVKTFLERLNVFTKALRSDLSPSIMKHCDLIITSTVYTVGAHRNIYLNSDELSSADFEAIQQLAKKVARELMGAGGLETEPVGAARKNSELPPHIEDMGSPARHAENAAAIRAEAERGNPARTVHEGGTVPPAEAAPRANPARRVPEAGSIAPPPTAGAEHPRPAATAPAGEAVPPVPAARAARPEWPVHIFPNEPLGVRASVAGAVSRIYNRNVEAIEKYFGYKKRVAETRSVEAGVLQEPPGSTLKEILKDNERSRLFGAYLEEQDENDLAEKLAQGNLDGADMDRLSARRTEFVRALDSAKNISERLNIRNIEEIIASSPELKRIADLVGSDGIHSAVIRQFGEIAVRDPRRSWQIADGLARLETTKREIAEENGRIAEICQRYGISDDQYLAAVDSGSWNDLHNIVKSKMGTWDKLKLDLFNDKETWKKLNREARGIVRINEIRASAARLDLNLKNVGAALQATLVESETAHRALMEQLQPEKPERPISEMSFAEMNNARKGDTVKKRYEEFKKNNHNYYTPRGGGFDENAARHDFAEGYAKNVVKTKGGFWANLFAIMLASNVVEDLIKG